jgi:hypothetical protein
MHLSGAYSDVTLTRMASAYEYALQELHLDSMVERERLATCILSVGNSSANVYQLLERAVRLFHRAEDLQRQPDRAPASRAAAIRVIRKSPSGAADDERLT